MSKPPAVTLRVRISLPLFERVCEYRHAARHETKNQALVCLINAGLAALAKPAALPLPLAQPGPKKLISFAGSDDRKRAS